MHTLQRPIATWRSLLQKAGVRGISIALAIHSLDCTLQLSNRDLEIAPTDHVLLGFPPRVCGAT